MSDHYNLTEKKILVLEDEETVFALIKEILEDVTKFVYNTPYLEEARKRCAEERFDLILLDYNVKDGIGWDLVDDIAANHEKYGNPVYVFMSGTVSLDLNSKPLWLNTEFVPKPFPLEKFRNIVIRHLKK